MINGRRVKEARLKMGLSQQELGDKLGVTKVSVCGYETGMRTPTLETFLDLLDVLELDFEYVLGREVSAISEKGESYGIKVSKDDLEIMKELKKNKTVYHVLQEDPKRGVELIARKLNK